MGKENIVTNRTMQNCSNYAKQAKLKTTKGQDKNNDRTLLNMSASRTLGVLGLREACLLSLLTEPVMQRCSKFAQNSSSHDRSFTAKGKQGFYMLILPMRMERFLQETRGWQGW